MYLAAAGVGHLGLVDFDVVDASNLQRQVIHGTSDIGRPKLESARDKITEINLYVRVTLHETRLSSENARELVRDYDLVVDGSDNFPTRYLVNDACVLEGKPYVWGSIYRFDGQASVFWAEHGPCYRCLYPEPLPAGHGPLPPRAGSWRALRHRGLGPGQRGRQAALWHRRPAGRAAADLRRPGAVLQGHQRPQGPRMRRLREEPHGHRADRLRGVLRRGLRRGPAGGRQRHPHPRPGPGRCSTTASSLLVDVRELAEWQINRSPGATLIPLDTLPDHLAELPQTEPVVLYCKSGVRSAEALALLGQSGFSTARHLGGGSITAWAKTVDPSVPVY